MLTDLGEVFPERKQQHEQNGQRRRRIDDADERLRLRWNAFVFKLNARFVSRSNADGRSRLMDEDEGGGQYQNLDGSEAAPTLDDPNHDSNIYSYESGAGKTTRNKILTTIDGCFCCGCAKRWQLAILANVGFIIVFGIRCNFGAARSHMNRNYTDHSGHLHVRNFVNWVAQFNWTTSQLAMMESSFFYGYIITQLPGGFLAARFPPNKLFGMAIGVASMLNVLMPAALYTGPGFVDLIQILQGIVQGVSYPAMHGCWRYWAPPMERSKLATTAFTGSYAGAVIGIPLSAIIVSYINWQTPFYLYGVLGVLWTVVWYAMIFEKPAFHPTITESEKVYIESSIGHISHTPPKLNNIPWKAILTSKPVWAIIVANFARSWTFYLLLIHQLTYMHERLGMHIAEGGFMAALPHAVMAVMVLAGGQLADYLRSREILSTTSVRKIFNCGGFGGEALFLLVVGYSGSNVAAAMTGLILAVGFSGFAISGFNVNHLDIAPRYASLLMGMSNGVGTISGMICPVVTERLRKAYGRDAWETIFLLASLIHFTGVTFYAIFASGELQDWAEPPPEEETWKPDDFAAKASHAGLSGGYGATEAVQIAPLPNPDQLQQKGDGNNFSSVQNPNFHDYQDLK